MPTSAPGEITTLLQALDKGHDPISADRLASLVYGELRSRANAVFRRERSGHTLQPTALVNETFLRLMKGSKPTLKNRAHFFAVAVKVMRQILVEYARQRKAKKRGDGQKLVLLDDAIVFSADRPDHIERLDDALTELARFDARAARVVELRFFGGLENKGIAAVLRISLATVNADWAAAKAWLRRELEK